MAASVEACRLDGGPGDAVILFRGPPPTPMAPISRPSRWTGTPARDEQQRAVERGGQGVEEAVGPYGVDEVGGRRVQLQGGVRLAGAGLARDQHGGVVAPEAEQVTARVQDGDTAPYTEVGGRAAGGVDQASAS